MPPKLSSTRPSKALSLVLLMPVGVLGGLAVRHVGACGGASEPGRVLLAAVFTLLVVTAPWIGQRLWTVHGTRRGLGISSLLVLAVVGWWAMQAPSADRDWAEAASRTPWAEIDGDLVTIHDVRNFRWDPDGTWTADWYDATYDVSRIEQGYFILTRFTDVEGVAHVMAGFRFGTDQFLNLSVEIRREDGETYDPIGGVFRQYEVIYIAADERDTLALRTNVWNDPTWVFPLTAGPEKTGAFFLDMVRRMNELHERPEWYNTLTNSCSTALASHYESVNEVSIPRDFRVLLPGYSDRVIEELGLLGDGLTATEARARYAVNALAHQAVRDSELPDDFSRLVRPWETHQPTP